MRSNTLPSIDVIKKEDKEAKLKAFISEHIASRGGVSADSGSERAYLLIARSSESPVVRALAAAVAESCGRGNALKALVAMPVDAAMENWPSELATISDGRSLNDLRLMDAHEQLWLDSETAWIGDCMRRDPAKRDAYECYANGCETTAQFVETAFSRLWDKGYAMAPLPGAICVSTSAEIDPLIASAAATDTGGPAASTRH